LPIADLEPARVTSLLGTKTYGRSLSVLENTRSTNDDARAALGRGAVNGHVIVADTQRAGRGARGNRWSSPPGTDLYLSIIDRPNLPLRFWPLLSLATGLGVASAVEKLIGTRPPISVKWPNDVHLGNRKCAGILIETMTEHAAVVIGIGLNVNRREWSDELVGTATSLAHTRSTPMPIDRANALAVLLYEVETWIGMLVSRGSGFVVTELERRLAYIGEYVRCGQVRGRLLGISENGAARIAGKSEIFEVVSGTLRPLVQLEPTSINSSAQQEQAEKT
jgi:BirA family transcriptional regulator, biotin operon repressor / biotin---[acetyl-CoA-carboxylase] ligase